MIREAIAKLTKNLRRFKTNVKNTVLFGKRDLWYNKQGFILF